MKIQLMMVAAAVGALCGSSYGLIMVGGTDKIEDHGQGWPAGTPAAANLDTRISWWEGPPFGGGQWHFQYVCENTGQFNKMLEVFSRIEADKLELVLHNGPQAGFVGDKKRYDWEFTVWIPKTFEMLHNLSHYFYVTGPGDANEPVPTASQAVPAPRIDLYLGGGGKVVWEKVVVPEKVTVTDMRPGSVDKKYAGKGLVRAEIVDDRTGEPIEGAQIELFKSGAGDGNDVRLTGSTDEKGKCVIGGVPAGWFEVTVTAKGYVSVAAERYDNTRPSVHDVKERMLEGVEVRGRVLDSQGKAMEGIAVTADQFRRADGTGYSCAEKMAGVTDSQGRFEIKGMPPGFASLRCRASGLYQSNHILQMWQAPTDKVVLRLVGTSTIKGEVIGQDGRRVTGKVLYELEAAGGAKVGTWGGSGYIKEDGTFEINGVPPGDYVIWVHPNPSSSRFEPVKEQLTVRPGKVYELTLMYGSEKKR